jgi:predicted ATP-grasp superfamily ATP-dependent carboligase
MAKKETRVALITAADHPTGLGTARALAGLDVQLIGLCTNPSSRFCRSRLWSRIISVPDDGAAYLENLFDLARSASSKIVIFPTQDELVLLLSDHRDALEKYYAFLLPEKPAVDLLMDKTAFHQWAQERGFHVPESYIVESQADLNHVLDQIAYPIVLKPLFRTPDWQIHSPLHKVIKLEARSDAGRIPFDLFACAPRFLVQRWIEGGDASVHYCLVYVDRNGHELGYYTGRKLLQWPRLTGSTAIGVGTDNPDVHELAQAVLRAAGLRGLGSLEVKESSEDGQYYITEPTVGRNNLQSFIATTGGVNLTQMAFWDAIEEDPMFVDGRRGRAVWIEEYSALQAVIDSVHHRELNWKDLAGQLKGRVSFASFSLRDPMPFLLLCKEMLERQMRKAVPRSQ